MEMIKMTNTLVSTREVPWMKLGTQLDGPMNVAQAAHLGGLDFTVSLRDVNFQDKDGEWKPAPHRKMVVADDTDEPFDVVSADYSILQYGEALDWLDQVNPKFVAAGTMKDRKQGFMVVQLPEAEDQVLAVDGMDDIHDMYVVVRTSHDRTRGIECFAMPLRRRCMNELGLRGFGRGVQNRWSIHHIGNVKEKLHTAEDMIDRVRLYQADLINTINRLYVKVIDNDDARQILKRVVRDTATQQATIDKIVDMWHNRETVSFAGTAWGLVNAVSEYYEWDRKGGTAQSQFLGVLEGPTRKAIDMTATLALARG